MAGQAAVVSQGLCYVRVQQRQQRTLTLLKSVLHSCMRHGSQTMSDTGMPLCLSSLLVLLIAHG